MNHKSSTNSHLKGCWAIKKKKKEKEPESLQMLAKNIYQNHLKWQFMDSTITRPPALVVNGKKRGGGGVLTPSSHNATAAPQQHTSHNRVHPAIKCGMRACSSLTPSLSLSVPHPSLPHTLSPSFTLSLPLAHKDLSQRAWQDVTEWTWTPDSWTTDDLQRTAP